KHFEPGFISNKLSEIALSMTKDKTNQIDFLFGLTTLLSKKAENHLLSFKEIESMDDLMTGLQLGLIEEITSEQEEMIINYLEKQKSNHNLEKKKGIKTFTLKNY